jgi:D-alanyl-lipoteichoic acid acyltransferase DltB (MBOAT superfamily)
VTLDSASFQFLAFGLTVALVSNFSRSRGWRSAVLMIASLVFLGLLARNPILFLPLAAFLLLGYTGRILLERGWSRLLVWSLLAVILAYIWLKKYVFLPQGIFLHSLYFTVGLSYIFFRVLHLLIETGDEGELRHIGPGSYLLYMLNFTTLLSGPIQRYDEFARDQFAGQPIELGPGVIGLQLERIIRGFFKVNVLAMVLEMAWSNALAQMSDPLPAQAKMLAAFKLVVIYPLFLYANFSGYIDIVIALARLMRVRLPENFDRPFSAASFLDFWNRWHITLSTWLKTYVYNPLLLVLMRRISSEALQPFLGVFCFFVTFFLVGVWHGRTSEFVLFGVLLGAGVSVNKLWQVGMARVLGRKRYRALTRNPVYTAFSRGLTFTWFAATNPLFWGDWEQLHSLYATLSRADWLAVWLATWLCASVVLALWEGVRDALLSIRVSGTPVLTCRYARVVYASALGLVALVVTVLLNEPAPGIVYKVF